MSSGHHLSQSFAWLDDVRRDAHYAVRTLANAPGFTLVAVLTLALGIGSVTVIYSVIHDVLLDPLPYPGSERFVNVLVQDTATGRGRNVLPASEFLDYQEQSDVFDGVVGTRGESMMLATTDRAEVLRAVRVTPNFFAVMGIQPLFGRTAGPADGQPDAAPVVILRHRAVGALLRQRSGRSGPHDSAQWRAADDCGRDAASLYVACGRRVDSERNRQDRAGCANRPQFPVPGAPQARRFTAAG